MKILEWALAGVAMSFIGGCGTKSDESKEEPHSAALVQVCRLEKRPVGQTLELIGCTQPMPGRAARICAGVEGRIVAILGDGLGTHLQEGQRVVAGQIIARLDDRIAAANLQKLQAGQKDVAEQLHQADYAVEMAKIEVRRLEAMTATPSGKDPSIVPETVMQKTLLQLEDAVSKRDSVVAKGNAGNAELLAAKEQLKLHELRTPIDGEIGLFEAQLGQSVTVGTTVAQVVDLSEIDVLCSVAPSSIGQLAVGQTATIGHPEAGHGSQSEEETGKVVYVASQGLADNGCFAVKVRFANRHLALRGNAIVHLAVVTTAEAPRLALPASCLTEDGERPSVLQFEPTRQDNSNAISEAKQPANGKETVSTKSQRHGTDEKATDDKELGERGVVHRRQALLGIRDRRHGLVEVVGLVTAQGKQEPVATGQRFVTQRGLGLHDGDEVQVQAPKVSDTDAKSDKKGD